MAAVLMGGIITILLTFIKPDYNFNWESTRALNNADHFIPQEATKPVSVQGIGGLDDKEKESGYGGSAGEKNQQMQQMQVLPIEESSYSLAKGV